MIYSLRFLLATFFIIISYNILAQQPTNTDPGKSYVNVNIPRTPEAAGFEKYGITSVNEFAGTPNISVPIYTLKSRFLEAPITLTYQPGGIKVNQEASWVGLGFDLIAGGRITVETRGSVDFCGETRGLFSTTTLASGMQNLYTRIGSSREVGVLTLSTLCEGGGCPAANTALPGFDILQAVQDMTTYGAGEPDIFRANFMGHNVTFYVNKITNNINFIGEQGLFTVAYTTDSYNNITGWTLKDNDGITYYFNQTETSTNTIPGSAIIPTTTTSAWLLTKAVHPSGDYIQFTYNNYGVSVPAFTMSSSIDWVVNSVTASISNDQYQNVNVQSPFYLTRAETADIAVDFALDTRTDLYGPGSRKLTQITVTDKLTNTLKKTATFNYSYFQGTSDPNSQTYLNSLFYYLPSPLSQSSYLACSNSRLRLDSVNVNNNSYQPSYRFYYNLSWGIPDKYSLSQDHWGYYNGVDNRANGYGFNHLIPYTFLGSLTAINTSFVNAIGAGNLGNSRECDLNTMQAMVLNKIVYPTGGSTEFYFEPHQSTMVPTVPITGGGLRVKTIKNYSAAGILADWTDYSYTGGKYMGIIDYYTSAILLPGCTSQTADPNSGPHSRLSSNAAINYNDFLVGYYQITSTQKDNNGTAINGYTKKTFNIITPSSNYSNNVGYDLVAPFSPSQEPAPIIIDPNMNPVWVMALDPTHKGLPPTPSCNLEGKLMLEQYFDNSNNLLKSTNYFYHLANYSNNFYDVRAIQNRVGGFNLSCTPPEGGFGTGGNRPVILLVSPAKTFHTLTDSIVETNYLNGNTLINRKYFTYDSYYQIKTEQVFNSDNASTTTTYTHPYDYLSGYNGGGSTMIYQMVGSHIWSPVFTRTVTRNGSPVSFINNNYYNPSTGVYVPQNTQVQVANNPIETREQYNAYDAYGHLLEKQKPGGVIESYLWGYDAQFPVARVVGSGYSTISGMVSPSTVSNPANDAALQTELNKLRGLSNALVTTYTYDNVYGMTSQTDPSGKTVYYKYDPTGRLSYIQDQNLNVVKRFVYNYAGQPEGYNSQITTSASAQNTTSVPWNVTFTNIKTGASSTYTVNPGSSSNVFANIAMGYYNITFTPQYPLSGNAQLIYNGVTYTGTGFTLSNVNINNTTSFILQPAASSGPCSFTVSSGYSSPTNGLSSNGTTVSGYFVFYSTSTTMTPGFSYQIATINGGCVPSGTRTFSSSSGGRTWNVTIYSNGQMYVQLAYGSPNLTPGSSTSINLSYNL
jgi:YD repeat-containing protein